MFSKAIRIAAAKAAFATEAEALDQCLVCAERLESVEAAFESRINTSKAARGEKPTRLSVNEREQLAGYAEDAAEVEEETLARFHAAPGAQDIVGALHAALESDLSFWGNAARYAHPADRPVIEEFVAAKRRLFDELARFRSRQD